MSEQVIFTGDPPKFILQQNKSVCPKKFYLTFQEDIFGNLVCDYEIIPDFLWCRFKASLKDKKFRYVSSCVITGKELTNTSDHKVITVYLENVLFNNFSSGTAYLIRYDEFENEVDSKCKLAILKRIAQNNEDKEDTLIKWSKHDKTIPALIITSNKEIFSWQSFQNST